VVTARYLDCSRYRHVQGAVANDGANDGIVGGCEQKPLGHSREVLGRCPVATRSIRKQHAGVSNGAFFYGVLEGTSSSSGGPEPSGRLACGRGCVGRRVGGLQGDSGIDIVGITSGEPRGI